MYGCVCIHVPVRNCKTKSQSHNDKRLRGLVYTKKRRVALMRNINK